MIRAIFVAIPTALVLSLPATAQSVEIGTSERWAVELREGPLGLSCEVKSFNESGELLGITIWPENHGTISLSGETTFSRAMALAYPGIDYPLELEIDNNGFRRMSSNMSAMLPAKGAPVLTVIASPDGRAIWAILDEMTRGTWVYMQENSNTADEVRLSRWSLKGADAAFNELLPSCIRRLSQTVKED